MWSCKSSPQQQTQDPCHEKCQSTRAAELGPLPETCNLRMEQASLREVLPGPRKSGWEALRQSKASADALRLTETVKGLNEILREGMDGEFDGGGGDRRSSIVGWEDLARVARRRPREPQVTTIGAAAQPLSQLFMRQPEEVATRGAIGRTFTRRMRNALTKPKDKLGWDEVLQSRREMHESRRFSPSFRRGFIRGPDGARTWVIDPRSSKWIGYVDGASLLALSFTALVTPYEVAFVKACSTSELWYSTPLPLPLPETRP